ncbi:MAG: hypothetical protein ACXW32_10315, partial [Limisphaerales bacterium]
ISSSATSLIKVNANNITNRGLLNVGANGFIQLHGRNVDLTSGKLVVGDIDDPLSGGGFGGGLPSQFDTNFFPAPGIYDNNWGLGNYTNTRIAGIITSVDPATVSTPTPPPQFTNNFGSTPSPILLDEAMLWTREEIIDETNEVVQVVAVQLSDPDIGAFASFVDQTYYDGPVGGFLTAMVELRVGSTDFSTFERVTNSLYIADQLGASTNRSLMQNNFFGTYRPGNFVVFRGFPDQFGGQPAMTNVRDDILVARLDDSEPTNPPIAYLNNIVTNDWAVYSATVESVGARLPAVPGVAVTNLGGQVEINAQQLNLRNTRVRGEGFVSFTAGNVTIGGENIIDSPRLSINFGSGSGNLQVNEFVPDFVERFNGSFLTYGTIFTNYYERYTTNIITDPGDPPDPGAGLVALAAPPTEEVVTNQVEVRFQVTIVDARGLQTREPVTVYDLKLTSTNGPSSVFFNENLTVNNSVRIDARELTFAEGSSLSVPLGWGFSYTNLINVRTFTNLGSLVISEIADLRRSEFLPYDRFFNGGLISADGVDIWADEFVNTGVILTDTLIKIRARTLRIDSGFFDAAEGFSSVGGDIILTAETASIASLEATARGRLVLDVSQSLNDLGPDSPNSITVEGGVEMSPDRPSGSLLGTTIVAAPRPGDLIDIIWASQDLGANAGAFQDNLALGRLVLESASFSIFQFLPARPGSALYVDALEINGPLAESLDALTNGIMLGMNVYFSDVTTTSTNGVITAEALDRIFGPNAPFNLIWVPSFVGPSSVEVALGRNGSVSRMNRSLRQSLVLDSDGDGIPNGHDLYPLTPAEPGEGAELVNVQRNASSDTISFNLSGSGSAKYVIEYTTNLFVPDWKAISGVLTSSELNGLQSFSDNIGQGTTQGYYRVKVVP